MDLEDWLEEQEETRRRQGKWPLSIDGVRHSAEKIWRRPLHRYYTDHSIRHSERIIDKLGKLTEDLIHREVICPTEVYILLASAYLHDIGMQHEKWMDTDLKRIREHHHELTKDLILDSCIEQSENTVSLGLRGLVPPHIVDVIACVAEAHRKTDLDADEYDDFQDGNEPIRPQLLAALLRLADELDIDHDRVDIDQLNLLDVSTENEFHWFLCYYVLGVRVQDGLITVDYRFPTECNQYEELVQPIVRGNLEKEFPMLRDILWSYGCKVTLSQEFGVRYVPKLRRMPDEVFAFVVNERRKEHERQIVTLRKSIDYFDSVSKEALTEEVETHVD